MILKVYSELPTFKTVTFRPDFNVVLAERTQDASSRDTRNGLGKTTLVEILHFLLGANLSKNAVLKAEPLRHHAFMMDVQIGGQKYTVRRIPAHPRRVYVKGPVEAWPLQASWTRDIEGYYVLPVSTWKQVLGVLMFDLPSTEEEKKYFPSFRSLVSYFARRGVFAFTHPFQHHPQQPRWDVQIHNAYLLGLAWEYAAQLQETRDTERMLREIRKAEEGGLLGELLRWEPNLPRKLTPGFLEAERVRLEETIRELETTLKDFKVHPAYHGLETEANQLTERLHDLVKQKVITSRLLEQYRQSLHEEEDWGIEWVERVYQETGLWFPERVRRRLEEVKAFHHQVVENRRAYLVQEMERLERDLAALEEDIQTLDQRRSRLLRILDTHHALEEYQQLTARLTELQQQLERIKRILEVRRHIQEEKRRLQRRRSEILLKMERDLNERRPWLEEAMRLFHKNSEFLYREPGYLSVDVDEGGYRFSIAISRAQSQGISRMKVFCYDLTLAQLWSRKERRPGFLVHDSPVFDGVDERQVARALRRALDVSRQFGFQYICTLNSDMVPYDEFDEDTREAFEDAIVIRLTDATPEGGLLGMRF